jgi:cobalt/nickel transport system ATP-binding protein
MKTKVIEIRDLNYSYPDGNEALKGVNIDIYQNETIGIIGPNGAGKTTLLLYISGLLNANGGIKICDLELNKSNLAEIRKKIGLVFQDPQDQLFMPTVFEDVAFGPVNMKKERQVIESSVHEALKEVDMLDSIDRMSYHLSFGEKKRVALATVLAMEPEILILDEPSSNLDPKARRHLIGILKNIKATKIISGHDLEMILEICNRVILLDNSKVIYEGETLQILSDEALMHSHGLEVPLSIKLKTS